jgi:hypothetical protein
MKQFFKQLFGASVATDEAPVIQLTPVKRNVEEIIQEIHETFFTEVDRLLEMAGIRKSEETEKQALLDKARVLKDLGFGNTKEVKEATAEFTRITNIQHENDAKAELIKAIQFFQYKYPLYKFITGEAVERICKKYNLLCGPVDKYIGTVPDLNVKQMQNFKIEPINAAYEVGWRKSREKRIRVVDYADYKTTQLEHAKIDETPRPVGMCDFSHSKICRRKPLQICAPQSDFDMQRMTANGHMLEEIPDPVVLQPVMWNGKEYFLVVTAWGLEASDSDVVNEKLN